MPDISHIRQGASLSHNVFLSILDVNAGRHLLSIAVCDACYTEHAVRRRSVVISSGVSSAFFSMPALHGGRGSLPAALGGHA